MKALLNEYLIPRWNNFSSKEKLLLSALAALTMFFMLYAFAWLPVQHGRERLAQIIPEKQSKLMQMQVQAADIEKLRQQYKLVRSTADGLKAAVEVSAKFHGIALQYAPPTNATNATNATDGTGTGAGAGSSNANELAILLNPISFDAWVTWVGFLQSENRVRIQSCRITPTTVAGQIKVEATLAAVE